MFKILIVEDDRGIAEGIQSLLEQWGMEARQVQDFRNITGEFETYQPHLILLDIKLPSYDGYYWCGQLRQRTAAPIIFISSAADNMNIVMAMNMGGDDFIAKPFDGSVLVAKVQDAAAQLSAGDRPAGAGVPGSGAEYCRPDPAV